MTEIELMVIGCLALGPLTGEQLCRMLAAQGQRAIDSALEQLRADERVLLLDSGRWALIHRT